MTVRLSSDWSYRGFRALVLENRLLRVVVLPELGGKIWSIVYKPRDREMLWHHPRVAPRPAPFGARYDDWFCGGWDELFPNDAPVTINGEPYPDHGEIWSMPADWEIVAASPDEATILLRSAGTVTTARFEKEITLRADDARLRLRYRIRNDGPAPIDFLWKLHPAVRMGERARIDLPAGRTVIDAGFAGEFGALDFTWPYATGADGTPVDMRLTPPVSALTARFFYARELTDGWCAITDLDEQIGFGLAFDRSVLNTVWVFGAYGGWRGLHTTLLEPCTGYPYQLDKAISQRTCAHLPAGETLATDLVATIYTDRTEVTGISRDGEVT